MKKKLQALIAVAAVAVLALGLVGCSSGSSDSGSGGSTSETTSLRFMTGGESGTYYAYGSVLGQYATNGDYGLEVTALSSNGSQANVQALQDDDADIVFCQSDVTAYAYNGTNLFEETGAYTDFSVVATLYQEQVQIVTCNPDIKTVADLAGKTVSVGAANSGVYFNAVDVLSAYDLTLDDITPVYQSFADSADSLKDDKIDAAFIVAGAPTTAIPDKSAYLVSMDDEHVEKLIAASPYYAKATIAADVYGLESDTTTVSVGAVVLASNYVSEDAIYNFTKSLFDGAENNAEAHAKYSELSLEEASSVTGVPYHPGAAKYYEEQGITVEAAQLA